MEREVRDRGVARAGYRRWAAWGLAVVAGVVPLAAAPAAAETYETKYYALSTDLPRDVAREAFIRLDRMYEEFGLAYAYLPLRPPARKLRAVLFTDKQDYVRNGGLPFSDGCYHIKSKSLYMVFNDKTDWSGVQHEAFHQFAREVMAVKLPTWLEEGTASYFGEAIFTGDCYVLGTVTDGKLALVHEQIRNGKLVNLPRLFAMNQAEWNQHYRPELYCQSWSIVHFLLHADPRAAEQLKAVVGEIAAGRDPHETFGRTFDTRRLGESWLAYWRAAGPNEADQKRRANVLTILSGVARTRRRNGEPYRDLDEYFRAARQVEMSNDPTFWLPKDVVTAAVDARDQNARWALTYDADRRPEIRCAYRDGRVVHAHYTRVNDMDRTAVREAKR